MVQGLQEAGLSATHRVPCNALAWRLELRRVGNSSHMDRIRNKVLSQCEDWRANQETIAQCETWEMTAATWAPPAWALNGAGLTLKTGTRASQRC